MSIRSIADRKEEFDFFETMLKGSNPERIFLISAPSESGKSVLLSEFAKLAAAIIGAGRCARINLKGEPPLDAVLNRICADLGPESFPKFRSAESGLQPVEIKTELPKARFGNENTFSVESHIHQAGAPSAHVLASRLIADFSTRDSPTLVIIDTFEQATVETEKWIVQQFLPLVRNLQDFWVVIAGKEVPEPGDYLLEWGDLARSHVLQLVTSPDHWHEYACLRYPNFPRAHIELVCQGLAARPSAIEEFIRVTGSRLSSPPLGAPL